MSSEIAISNLVQVAGHTDLAVALFDANGLVDFRCWRLNAGETAYADPLALGLPAGFRGSALISATSWTHEVSYEGGPRRIVGLGAAVVTRSAVLGVPVPGDEAGAVAGVPLLGPAGRMVDGVTCAAEPPPASVPTQSPPLTPGTPTPRFMAWSIHLPAAHTVQSQPSSWN